jgi:hypothetical protein
MLRQRPERRECARRPGDSSDAAFASKVLIDEDQDSITVHGGVRGAALR